MNVSLAIEGQVYSRIQVKAKTEKKRILRCSVKFLLK